jgi:hypothetical protein
MALGGLVLAVGLYGLGVGLLTLTWPRTDAVIVSAGVEESETSYTTPGTDKYRGGRIERRGTATFRVRYRYRVNGTDYEASGVEPADFGLQTSAAAREDGDTYAPGAHVKVAYDPNAPEQAYLRPGPSTPALKLLTTGGFFLLVGMWKRSRRR